MYELSCYKPCPRSTVTASPSVARGQLPRSKHDRVGFRTRKRSKDHAAVRESKARAFPISTDTCSDFKTKADMPAERASSSEKTSLYSLNMTTGTVGINVFRARAASMPFITGIDKSITIKSGCKA